MKATANTFLNVRVGRPSVNAPIYTYVKPGDQIEFDAVVMGDMYEGANLWLKGTGGNYYWIGGISFDWWLAQYEIPSLWSSTRGDDVKVAVIDSGINLMHPDLSKAVDQIVDYYDPKGSGNDEDSHGTECAGIIAARGVQSVIGVAPSCSLYVARIMRFESDGFAPRVFSEAIDWAIGKKVDIVSLSLGVQRDIKEIADAVRRLIDAGIVVVASIGNNGYRGANVGDYPARYDGCVSVGAADAKGEITQYTNQYSKLSIVAPGDNIVSTSPPQISAVCSGTSMATAYISGVFALMKAFKRNADALTLINAITDSSESKTNDGYTYRVVKPKEALNRLII